MDIGAFVNDLIERIEENPLLGLVSMLLLVLAVLLEANRRQSKDQSSVVTALDVQSKNFAAMLDSQAKNYAAALASQGASYQDATGQLRDGFKQVLEPLIKMVEVGNLRWESILAMMNELREWQRVDTATRYNEQAKLDRHLNYLRELATILVKQEDFTTYGYVAFDKKGRAIDCNEMAASIFNLTRNEVLQWDLCATEFDIVLYDGETPMQRDDYPGMQALKLGKVIYGRFIGVKLPRMLNRVWLGIVAEPIRRSDGEIIGAHNVFWPVSVQIGIAQQFLQQHMTKGLGPDVVTNGDSVPIIGLTKT